MANDRTVIVGGGIVGLAAAYFLARRGAPVTLLERDDFTDSASTGNAGLVAVGHGPLPRPGLVAKGLRWMLDRESPLYIPPSLDLNLVRWLIGFARACSHRHHAHAWGVMLDHGMHAGECFDRLVEDASIACGYRDAGQLDVFRNEDAFRAARAEADMLRRHGYEADAMSGAELVVEDPAYRPGLAGAIRFADRRSADPERFVVGLADAAGRCGADLRTGAPVAGLVTDDGRCHGVRLEGGDVVDAAHVVLAAGVWTTGLAADAGVPVPMQAGKGYHLDLPAPVQCPQLPSVLSETFVAVNPFGDRLRLAGTLEFTGINTNMLERRLEMLPEAATGYLRGVTPGDRARGRAWCGLRPCTADGLPAVGWTDVEGLFVATGHAMMGYALGPLTGRLVAESILDGRPSIPIDPISPRRFR